MRRWLPVLAALALATVLPAQQAFEVQIVAPHSGIPLFGDVEVRTTVVPASTPIERVEVFVDGVQVGTVTAPPWRLVVHVGEDNVEHRIEVVARSRDGSTASDVLESAALVAQDTIDVELRPLFVRVEEDGMPVVGLRREDFTVYDDGIPQRIVTFEGGDVPFTAVLLLDGSISMRGEPLAQAVGGVQAFARTMQRLDEAKLLLFADRVLLETPFTNSPALLTLGITETEGGGGTALNDALYLALARLAPRSGRKVVLVLSDGVDVESALSMEHVRAAARREPVILFWLRIGAEGESSDALPSLTPWRATEAHGREKRSFRETVVESGGRILRISQPEELRGALQAVLAELRGQYVIGYQSSVRKGPGTWHEVRVEVKGGHHVRTHAGYTEP